MRRCDVLICHEMREFMKPGHAGDVASVWSPGGCMEVVCEDDEWAQGWMGAEAADAASRVEAALDAPSAWLPAEQAWDPAASTSTAAFDGAK